MRPDRQAILRGVYEDNLRTVQGGTPPAPPAAPLRRQEASAAARPGAGRRGLALGGLVALFAVAGLLYQGLGVGQPKAAALVRPARADSVAAPLEASVLPVDPDSGGVPTVAHLYGLALKTIVLDPGHGGIDPGAIGKEGLREKEITLDVAHRLKRRLDRAGYHVLLTRTGDEKLTLRQRIAFANEHKADLFISLHVNALAEEALAPIETYFYGPGSDARARRLAAQENRHSGYTVAEFDELTRQLGLELKMQESKDVAVSIQKGLYRNMRAINENVSDWGAKSGDFMVLLGVKAPSVLAEMASISNRSEEAKLRTAEHRERLAMFLEEGIVGYLGQHAPSNTSEHATEAEE